MSSITPHTLRTTMRGLSISKLARAKRTASPISSATAATVAGQERRGTRSFSTTQRISAYTSSYNKPAVTANAGGGTSSTATGAQSGRYTGGGSPSASSTSTSTSPAQANDKASAPSSSSSSTSPPAAANASGRVANLSSGLGDAPAMELSDSSMNLAPEGASHVDWTRSYHGLSTAAFSPEAAAILLAPLPSNDIELKPDGIVYLPEIKYRRILNRAFGPGAWGLAPRGETIVTAKAVTREYALVVHGRLVSISRGEQDYFSPEGIPTATEGCKSNALMRCCKDLGVASELWDPRFIRGWLKEHGKQVWVEHTVNKRKKLVWIRKDGDVPAMHVLTGRGS